MTLVTGPRFVKGDLFKQLRVANVVTLATTNGIVKGGGALVMGAGNARELRDRLPGIDVALGRQVVKHQSYGLITARVNGIMAGGFQTKRHWSDPSPLELIEFSTWKLVDFAREHPELTINLPFPGIGLGGLRPAEVKPILDRLPSNVTVWVR